MEFKDINFNREKVLENLNHFYHYGINFDNQYNELEIIEDAINDTHGKLIEALKGSTHVHKRNMIFTFQRLVEMYEIGFIHVSGDYYNDCLRKICLKRFETNKELIEKIEKIIIHNQFSHREQRILLRPYLFDFEINCSIPWYRRYKELRNELKKKLQELILKWISEDKEIESVLDERVLKLIANKKAVEVQAE